MWKLYNSSSLTECLETFKTVEDLEQHVNNNPQLDKFLLVVKAPDGQIMRYATPASAE